MITYGEFILVIQAKSKRLTIQARSGDPAKIQSDFSSSIQAAYDQAVKFIDLVLDGAECECGRNNKRSFAEVFRAFPLVVLSDHFPALTYLGNHLIKRKSGRDPLILGLFFLEVMLSVLNHPVDALYYLQQRARFFERVMASSEFDLLGYHLAQKLYVPDDVHFMSTEHSFGSDLDDYFSAMEAGRTPSVSFRRLEERVEVPMIASLISALKAGPPELAGTAIEVLDFSGGALQRMADTIVMVREEVKAGKRFRAFSIETHYGGITYVAVSTLSNEMTAAAEAIGRKHKYNAKKDRWYVVLDHINSASPVDGIISLRRVWTESGETEEFLRYVDTLTRSTRVSFRAAAPVEKPASD